MTSSGRMSRDIRYTSEPTHASMYRPMSTIGGLATSAPTRASVAALRAAKYEPKLCPARASRSGSMSRRPVRWSMTAPIGTS